MLNTQTTSTNMRMAHAHTYSMCDQHVDRCLRRLFMLRAFRTYSPTRLKRYNVILSLLLRVLALLKIVSVLVALTFSMCVCVWGFFSSSFSFFYPLILLLKTYCVLIFDAALCSALLRSKGKRTNNAFVLLCILVKTSRYNRKNTW